MAKADPKKPGTTWRCQDCGLVVTVTTGNKQPNGELLCCNEIMTKQK